MIFYYDCVLFAYKILYHKTYITSITITITNNNNVCLGGNENNRDIYHYRNKDSSLEVHLFRIPLSFIYDLTELAPS